MVMKPVGIPCCIYVFVSFFDCSGTNLGCVSLLNSKFPIIIRKQIFCSLLKSKNGLLIQMIHNGGGFFGSYQKPDTLDTLFEGFLYYGYGLRVNLETIHTSAV